jgi:hypothetical protein
MKNVYKSLVLKLEGKRLRVKLRHREENNNSLDLKEVEVQSVEWIDMTQGRDP